MDEIPLSQSGEVILESMSITQKKASYPEVAILNHSLENWGKGDVCQEYFTPDCLKHAGVPETSTSMDSSFTRKRNKSQHSPGRFKGIISGMNNLSVAP